MNQLPEEIESQIYDYVVTDSLRLKLLLNQYPLQMFDQLLKDFSRDQLDRIYKEGCISKIFCPKTLGYDSFMQQDVKHLFPINTDNVGRRYYHHSISDFDYMLSPVSLFREFWGTKDKKRQPFTPEYIRRITKFCKNLLEFPYLYHRPKNENLIQFSQKVVHQLLIGILIMHKNNQHSKSKQ